MNFSERIQVEYDCGDTEEGRTQRESERRLSTVEEVQGNWYYYSSPRYVYVNSYSIIYMYCF